MMLMAVFLVRLWHTCTNEGSFAYVTLDKPKNRKNLHNYLLNMPVSDKVYFMDILTYIEYLTEQSAKQCTFSTTCEYVHITLMIDGGVSKKGRLHYNAWKYLFVFFSWEQLAQFGLVNFMQHHLDA